eukprot:6197833-Pleurochrysis_carterae.AAC.1
MMPTKAFSWPVPMFLRAREKRFLACSSFQAAVKRCKLLNGQKQLSQAISSARCHCRLCASLDMHKCFT